MPSLPFAYIQSLLAAPEKAERCPRRVCRRQNRCVPPPDRDADGLYRCRFASYSDWKARIPVARQKYEEVLRSNPYVWAKFQEALKGAEEPPKKASAGGLRSGRGGSRPR